MSKDRTISNFNGRLCDIANESFSLGEEIPKERLVKKTLRSLPLRVAYKATTVREAEDLNNMRLEELIRSLRTFEMQLTEEFKKKETCGTMG